MLDRWVSHTHTQYMNQILHPVIVSLLRFIPCNGLLILRLLDAFHNEATEGILCQRLHCTTCAWDSDRNGFRSPNFPCTLLVQKRGFVFRPLPSAHNCTFAHYWAQRHFQTKDVHKCRAWNVADFGNVQRTCYHWKHEPPAIAVYQTKALVEIQKPE